MDVSKPEKLFWRKSEIYEKLFNDLIQQMLESMLLHEPDLSDEKLTNL